MTPRTTLIAVLILIEIAVGGEIVAAGFGYQPGQWPSGSIEREVGTGSNLVEGGPQRTFEAGSRPGLTVDIGNADLTIRTGTASQFEVSISKSTAYGLFRARAPIAARKDGDTLRIATTDRHHWRMGDNRMVTVLLPAETRVTVVNAGDIDADGLRSEASFNSTNGTITVRNYDAPALHAVSSNGRITLEGIVATRLNVASSDGRIDGTALQVRDGSVESSDGDVKLGFAQGADTLVTAQTSDGTFRALHLPSTASDGTPDDTGSGASGTVRIGNADGRLDVRSSNGNIELSQS